MKIFPFLRLGGIMTDKQKTICYYRLQGYSPRQCALICGVSDNYARRIINSVEEIDLTDYFPPVECVLRRRLIDHILNGAGYAYIPNTEKYAYVSLLGYLGLDYKTLKEMFPDDRGQFIYMALHRSDKA